MTHGRAQTERFLRRLGEARRLDVLLVVDGGRVIAPMLVINHSVEHRPRAGESVRYRIRKELVVAQRVADAERQEGILCSPASPASAQPGPNGLR